MKPFDVSVLGETRLDEITLFGKQPPISQIQASVGVLTRRRARQEAIAKQQIHGLSDMPVKTEDIPIKVEVIPIKVEVIPIIIEDVSKAPIDEGNVMAVVASPEKSQASLSPKITTLSRPFSRGKIRKLFDPQRWENVKNPTLEDVKKKYNRVVEFSVKNNNQWGSFDVDKAKKDFEEIRKDYRQLVREMNKTT